MELQEYKQLKLAFNGENEYEYARHHQEIKEFYFGIGKYWQLDYESKYEHDSLRSWDEMKKYSDKIGNEQFIPIFIEDIEQISKNDLNVKELFFVFYFLYVMSKFIYEKQLNNKLLLSQATVDLLKSKLIEFDQIYGDKVQDGVRYDEIKDIRAWPPNLVDTCKKTMIWMQERFGYGQFG